MTCSCSTTPTEEPASGSLSRRAVLTGGLALDVGLLAALREELVAEKMALLQAESHAESIYAGAIGAALWGAFRHEKLKSLDERKAA